MVFVNGYILISLFAAFGFFYGLLLFLSDYEENKCEMTYMFQYPQFVRISTNVDKQFSKYGLYSYSEGQFTERARKMHFTGIPVLFVPGNAGSYKQVRSLASVALRKALNSRTGFHFDYFTIDFNEELSGLNGALLYDQVAYVEQCIYQVLDLYSSNKDRPTSVVLIGHSMGGVVIEGLLSSLRSNDIISLVITLAAPHKRAPLFFDVYSYMFYKNIKDWNTEFNSTFITVFGGFSDFLMTPHLTISNHLNVAATHIPKVWLSTDHLCILWCKQLVLVLNRALFDSVDIKSKQISQDNEYVTSVFKHHLLYNNGVNFNLRKQYDSFVPIDHTGKWIEYLPRQYSIELQKGTRETQWYMVRLVNQPLHEMLTIVAVNLEVTNWIFVCSASTIKGQTRVCVDAMHLSHLSEIVVSERYKRRLLNINLHNLSTNFTHVVARVPPTSDPVTLHVDVHSEAARKLTVNLPTWTLKNTIIIDETSENSLYYELHFPELRHVIQSYQLFVEPKKCKSQSHHATATLSVPWGNLDYHAAFTEAQSKPMNIRLYSPKPSDMTNTSAFVKLILDPSCKYSVSIKLAIPNTLGQIARYYSPFIFANIIAVMLLSFRSQLNNIDSKRSCSFIFTALMTNTKPYYILPVAKISGLILSSAMALKVLPIPDTQITEGEGIVLPLAMFLYILSVGLVWILTMILAVSIFCFESTVHKIVLKIIGKSVIGTTNTYDWLLKGLKKFPGFVAFVLLILCVSTCGGLALCLGLIFYFLKLTQMAQDIVENIVMKLIKLFAKKLNIPPTFQRKIQRLLLRDTQEESTDRKIKPTKDAKCDKGDEDNNSNQNETSTHGSDANTSTDETSTSSAPADLQQQSSENKDDNSLFAILGEITENNELYFHFTIFCLWFLVTCINIPIVLTWAHNFKFSSKLDTDPSFIPGLVLCTCALALWQFKYPKIDKKWYKELGYIIYVLAVFSAMYGVLSVFRLNYVLTTIIALVTLHQLLAPNRLDTTEGENSQSSDYERVKAKWE